MASISASATCSPAEVCPGAGYQCASSSEHGLYVDGKDNVWIGVQRSKRSFPIAKFTQDARLPVADRAFEGDEPVTSSAPRRISIGRPRGAWISGSGRASPSVWLTGTGTTECSCTTRTPASTSGISGSYGVRPPRRRPLQRVMA